MRSVSVAVIAALLATPCVGQDREETKIGSWTLLSMTDAMTDQSRGIASLEGDGGSLVVKCDSGGGRRKMYVSLIADDYLGAIRNDDREVMIRFGSATPYSQNWWHDGSTANQLDERRATEFINQLVVADRLALRLTTYQYRTVNVSFNDLNGAREAIAQAYVLCGQTAAFPSNPDAEPTTSISSDASRPN